MNSREDAPLYTVGQRLVALAYGVLCHSLFVLAIGAMAVSLFSGLTHGLGPFRGWAAVGANAILLLSFPILHSLLLSSRGRGAMSRLVPLGIGKDLSTTVFATLSSLNLLAVFALWSPSGIVWWRAHGVSGIPMAALYAGAWLLLAKSMADAQLGLQTGSLGWSSVFRNHRPVYKEFATRGVYRHVRQPIYVSFALILWLGSVWSPDQLVLALLWTGYCLVGSAIKERRYRRYFGESFRRYQQRVPFWLPWMTRQDEKPTDCGSFTRPDHGV